MPQRRQLETIVPAVTAQDLLDVVFGGDAFLRAYHTAVDKCADTRVGEWSGGTRTVAFTTPVDAPAFIKRLVGKDVMSVVETQCLERRPDGSLQLTSVPVPDMPGGAKFSTQAVFTFADVPTGCRLHCEVVCTAAGPFGLTSTIESFMAAEAEKSLGQFFAFIPTFLAAPEAAAAAAAAATAALPTPAALSAAAPVAPAAAPAAEAEPWYDEEELPLPPFPVMAPAEGLRFEDAALLYLRYQCRTGDQLVGLLQMLEQQVRQLEGKVSALQSAAEERARNRRWLLELPETIGTRQAVLGAALVATASAAAALMYGGRRQQISAS